MTKKTTVGAVENEDLTSASLAEEHREKSSSRATNSLELIDQFLKLLGKTHDATWVRYLDPLKKKPAGGGHHWFGTPEDLEKLQQRQSQGFDAFLIIGNGATATGTCGNQQDSDIESCPALFIEWDDKTLDWQVSAWKELGLPEPSIQVHTGGKSIHCYWPLDEPMTPAAWRVLQKRLIAHCGADPANCNPSRLMRLPGSIYHDKKTGVATGISEIIHSSERRYSAAEIEACLPPLLAKAIPLKGILEALIGKSESRSIDEIKAAAAYIPDRIGGEGTYDHDRNALCGCAAALTEAGYPESIAIELLGHKWPSVTAAEQVLNSATTRNAASFWKIAADNGYQLTRKRSKTSPEIQGDDPSRSEAKKLYFSELLEQALTAIRAGDIDTEMELRAEIIGRFKRSDTQITAALFRLLTEQETGKPVGSTKKAESLDLDGIDGMDALLDGFIPANDLGLLYGSKGSGKSVAALGMAFATIDGTGFLDHTKPAQEGPVLFIASDSGAAPLMAQMQDLGVSEHSAARGEDRSFHLWAHSPSQGMQSWCASINGCVELLQFVKTKGIKLVLIDSAKTICAKAGISYLDNDSIAALLTFIKEAICVHASVMILSHDGTENGSHSGAKVWAEVPSIVHNIQQIPDAPDERLWRVVKNRMGSLRQLRYQVGEDGGLEVCTGVETIGDATAAVIQVLSEAAVKGINSLSRGGLVQEIGRRFRLAPKTVDNTLYRLVRAVKPEVCRVANRRGHYKLSPRVEGGIFANSSIGISPKGKEQGKKPVSESDLVTSRGVGSGNSTGTQNGFLSSSRGKEVGKSLNTCEGAGFSQIPSQNIEIPIGEPALIEETLKKQQADAELPAQSEAIPGGSTEVLNTEIISQEHNATVICPPVEPCANAKKYPDDFSYRKSNPSPLSQSNWRIHWENDCD